MKKLVLFFSLLMLLCSLSHGKVVAKDHKKHSLDDTSANGAYQLKKQQDTLKLIVSFDVRKRGFSGVGKGAFGLVVFDHSFKPIFNIDKGLAVGAHAGRGTAKKSWAKSYTITGQLAGELEQKGLVLAFNVNAVSDRLGIPTSLKEWKAVIKESASFAADIQKMTEGSKLTKEQWTFIKLAGAGI